MKEVAIEKKVISHLEKLNYCPVSCSFSYSAGEPGGMLSVTFLTSWGLDQILDLLDYQSAADKSGFEVFCKSNTLVLSGYAMLSLFKKI